MVLPRRSGFDASMVSPNEGQRTHKLEWQKDDGKLGFDVGLVVPSADCAGHIQNSINGTATT